MCRHHCDGLRVPSLLGTRLWDMIRLIVVKRLMSQKTAMLSAREMSVRRSSAARAARLCKQTVWFALFWFGLCFFAAAVSSEERFSFPLSAYFDCIQILLAAEPMEAKSCTLAMLTFSLVGTFKDAETLAVDSPMATIWPVPSTSNWLIFIFCCKTQHNQHTHRLLLVASSSASSGGSSASVA